ncbi:MAG TPA: hypothetical protein VMP01_05485 [Pirellulaceae bacterium]|nr:hypothetical protein [Pirellulaceae bacterium]
MNEGPWLALLALIAILIALVLALVIVVTSIWLMIWPVEGRARLASGRFRFRLIDLGCLLVYWQVILAVISGFHRDHWDLMLTALAVFGLPACGVMALIWCACVNVLSRARIQSSARRAAFILISIPGAIAAVLSLVISGAMSVAAVIEPLDRMAEGRGLTPAMVFLATCVAIVLLRLVSLWIAADAKAA